MNGAQTLLRSLVNCGVEVCFANPGTTELPLVTAADRVERLKTVLGLFEGVCTGAADGYARMTRKPAATLLHLGPGLANGLANLHNARRAGSPVVNIVGDQASYHLAYDPPLASDIVSLAKPVSGWIRVTRDATQVASDAGDAVSASLSAPGQVATLIVPADFLWEAAGEPATARSNPNPLPVGQTTVRQIADVLRRGEPAVLLMTGPALMAEGLWLAGRISRATGARVMTNRLNGRLQRGAGRAAIEPLPYFPGSVLKTLAGTAHLILVGAAPPVSFFAYPGMPSQLTPDETRIYTLALPTQDVLGALRLLADELAAPDLPAEVNELNRPSLANGELSPAKVWQSLAALMPEEAIICDESITSGRGAQDWTAGAPPHDWLSLTGGAIGQGPPLAIGAAVACPERQVFSMQADGSAMYTLQALWTQAREKLNIITVLFANRNYNILKLELERSGAENIGFQAARLVDIGDPNINWVKLAEGMGVSASCAEDSEAFNQQLKSAIGSPGPHLIEVIL